ncbi:MAG: hypothetical protein WBM40_09605, partial [Thiohalocapsa sp.]
DADGWNATMRAVQQGVSIGSREKNALRGGIVRGRLRKAAGNLMPASANIQALLLTLSREICPE